MTQKETAAPGQNTLAGTLAGKNQPVQPTTPEALSSAKAAANEEPALLLEPDVPSDGPDEIGEAMIRDLPQRTKLSEPPSQPDASSNPA